MLLDSAIDEKEMRDVCISRPNFGVVCTGYIFILQKVIATIYQQQKIEIQHITHDEFKQKISYSTICDYSKGLVPQ